MWVDLQNLRYDRISGYLFFLFHASIILNAKLKLNLHHCQQTLAEVGSGLNFLQAGVGDKLDRRGMLEHLIAMQFTRTPMSLARGKFLLRGQVFEIMPVNEELIYRFEISDKIDLIEIVDPITRNVKANSNDAWFFPAKHYVINEEEQNQAFQTISSELEDRLNTFKKQGKALEYERLDNSTLKSS